MGKQSMSELCCKADRCLSTEILRRYRAGQSDEGKQKQKQAHTDDIALICMCNTGIDNSRYDKRYKQFKGCLQHLKKRRKNAFLFVLTQIDE